MSRVALRLLSLLFILSIRAEKISELSDARTLDLLINICPSGCSCALEQNMLEVDCMGRNLTSIPIPGRGFQSTTSGRIVDLMFAKNEILDLTKNAFQNYSTVEIITIYSNLIEKLDVEAFSGLVRLKEVDLSDNFIEYIYPDTFKDNPNLETVRLSGNELVKISGSLPILNAPNLKNLYLSACKLSYFSDAFFTNLKSLQTLDLSSNDLTTLSPNSLFQIKNLKDINLTNNRWTCDCKLNTILDWISQRKSFFNHKPIRCLEDNGATRKLWSASSGTNNYCRNETNSEIIFKMSPGSKVAFDNSVTNATVTDISGKSSDDELGDTESKTNLTFSDIEKSMSFGGFIFMIKHKLQHVHLVYLIIIVALIFLINILIIIILAKQIMKIRTRNLDKTKRKHNLTLSFGHEVTDKRSSIAPLLEPNSPSDRECTTPIELDHSDLPQSLYYDYINNTPEHFYQVIR